MDPRMQILMAAFTDEMEKLSMLAVTPAKMRARQAAQALKKIKVPGGLRNFARGRSGARVMPGGSGRNIGELGQIAPATVADAGKDLSRYAR